MINLDCDGLNVVIYFTVCNQFASGLYMYGNVASVYMNVFLFCKFYERKVHTVLKFSSSQCFNLALFNLLKLIKQVDYTSRKIGCCLHMSDIVTCFVKSWQAWCYKDVTVQSSLPQKLFHQLVINVKKQCYIE